MLRGALVAFAHADRVQTLVANALAAASTPTPTRLLLLDTIARAELKELPTGWTAQLERSLGSSDAQELHAAVLAAANWKSDRFAPKLLAVGRDASRPAALRVAALAAAEQHAAPMDDSTLDFLLSQLAAEIGALERTAAARTVGDAALRPEQLARLLPSISAAGPLELPALVRAFQTASDSAIGSKLVEALAGSPGLMSLSRSAIAELLARYPDEVRAAAKPILARLDAGADQQRKQLADLLPRLADGDSTRGKSVFASSKAACSACHRAGDEGGRIGPDLSKIGGIRTKGDLAESILIPSASLARGYESYTVTTQSGQVHAGLLARETATAIYLQTTERAEIRIDRGEIDQIAPSVVSIMPQGLDKILSADELRDLIAYLRSLK